MNIKYITNQIAINLNMAHELANNGKLGDRRLVLYEAEASPTAAPTKATSPTWASSGAVRLPGSKRPWPASEATYHGWLR